MNNYSSSSVYRKILNGLNDMSPKELASQQGYFEILKKIAISMLRENEIIYPNIFAKDSDMTGCTNGNKILINTWSPVALKVLELKNYLESGVHNSWDDQLPKITNVHQTMYLANVGLTCHELGHVLYTNFNLLNEVQLDLINGNFDGCNQKEKLEKIYNSKFKKILQSTIRYLVNCVEDGYIENCLALEYPSTGNAVRGLQTARDMLFFGSDPWLDTIEKVTNGEMLLINAFNNAVLIDCVRDYKLKNYDDCDGFVFEILDEAIQKAKPICRDYIISSENHKKDIYALLDIASTLFPSNPDSAPDPESGEGEADENTDSNENSKSQQGKGKGKGKSKQSQSSSQGGNSQAGESDEKSEFIESQEASEQAEQDTDDDMSKLGGKDGKGDIDPNNTSSSYRDPTKNDQQTQEQMQKAADEAFKNAKKNDTEDSFIKDIAKGTAEKQEADEQTKDLQKQMNEIRGYFKAERYNVVGVQQANVTDYDRRAYLNIYEPIKSTAMACARRVNQLLKRREYEDEDSGYAFGNRIVCHDLYRQDRKCFSKELVPDEQPDVVFTIMVDESGSMSGEKIKRAREAAILFDAIATEVKIPTRIIGHTTRFVDCDHQIVIDNYRNFKSNGNEKYSLAQIRDENGNVDTIVLSGLCEELLTRPEEKKVVIVISDGAPCGYDSSGRKDFKGVPYKNLGKYDDETSEQLNACVRYYRKKGVKVIGVAIDEVDVIKRIYEDGTLDCTDLKKLPNEMVKLFKKYVLK